MKKLLLLLLPLACILAGCKYDDSKIWEELEAQKAKITALESLNSNVSSLQAIVSALQNKITVTAIRTTDKGHSVSFSDGSTVTILSEEAATPKIGAKQDTDGNYYWTVGGNWLLDASGNKVTTSRTPKLKVDDDQWMVSYDDGATWAKVDGQAASVCLFESVTSDADKAVFTLSDGSVITIPLANDANKLQLVFDERVFEKMRNGEVLSTPYKIMAPEGAVTNLETFESDGWTVTVYPTDEKTGRISIKAPANVIPTKVLFLLTDDNGGSFVKIIKIGLNEEAKPEVKTEYSVDYKGGDLVIPVNSCTASISEGSEEWLKVVSLGDQVILNVSTNESYDFRNAEVTLEDGTVVSITQTTKDALILSSNEVNIDGRRQKVEFIVNTNIRVTATVTEGSDWLSVTPTTRGLTQKLFTFTAKRNDTGEARTAKVEFSGNGLKDVCTVNQAVYDGPTSIDVTEALATEEGDDVELATSKVMAVTSDGYVVTDGESAIMIFDGKNAPELGDSVSVEAVAGTFNGITVLEGVTSFNTSSTGNRVVYPSAKDITSSVDSYEAATAQFVCITGDLVVENKTYNLVVTGASNKVEIYKPTYVVGLEALEGHKVTVSGYYYGTSDGTVYIIAAKKEDHGESIKEGTLVTVTEFINYARTDLKLKLKGTVSNFNSKYCSFDLTDDSGKIYVYSVANKEEWSSKITNGGTVELLGYYQYYEKNSQHEVINAEILSFTAGDDPGGDTPGGGGSEVSGDTETIDFSAQGYSNAQAITGFSGSMVSISFDKGTNSNGAKYYNTGNAIRLYGSNSMTVSAPGKTIVEITLTFGSGDGSNEITVDAGSYSDGTWTGSESSVTFTIGGTSGHRRIAGIAVTVAEE